MKLKRVRLRNFRCYKEETTFDIDELTVFVGKNDIGKSTLLDALHIFFEEVKIDADDATISGDKDDVRIICEFEDFPEDIIIDTDYPTSLEKEFLLNEKKRLEIHKIYNGALKNPKLKTTIAVAMHPTNPDASDLLLLKNKGLKDRAKKIDANLDGVDQKINSQLRQVIWSSIPDLKIGKAEIPLDKETAKTVWDQLKKYMPSYALFKSDRQSTDQDVEAQDPMKQAIKEAIKTQLKELSEIENRVNEQVTEIANKTVKKLQEMDPELAEQLTPRFSTPAWANVFKVSLTGDDQVPINKRGSGIRRLILLNFFRAKAEKAAHEKDTSKVIYAIEEPETSQHPNNQKMLMKAFHELAANPDCQVILTTHNPALVRNVPIKSIRHICLSNDKECRDILYGDDTIHESLIKDLGILPDHDVKLFIGVEGINDINFLKGMSQVLNGNGYEIPDLDDLEKKGQIIFIPCGGSNLSLWASRLADLNRPEFHLFDRDDEIPKVSKYQSVVDSINERDNCKAYLTEKREMENYIHPNAIMAVKPDINVSFSPYDDVPVVVAKAIHDISDSTKSWDEVKEKKQKEKARKAKVWLNQEAVANMTPELLQEIDEKGEVVGWFQTISKLIK